MNSEEINWKLLFREHTGVISIVSCTKSKARLIAAHLSFASIVKLKVAYLDGIEGHAWFFGEACFPLIPN